LGIEPLQHHPASFRSGGFTWHPAHIILIKIELLGGCSENKDGYGRDSDL